MKLKIRNASFILILFLLFASYIPYDEANRNKVLLNAMMQTINSNHYDPQQLNDSFSSKLFTLYLERIDYNKKFLLQPDVDQLKKYEYSLDDEIKNGTYEFFGLSLEILKKRVKADETLYKEILEVPFDFNKEEMIETDAEKILFAKNEEELKEAWRKYLKFQTLIRLGDLLKVQDKKDTTIEVKSFEELEEEARSRVLKTHEELFQRMARIEDDDRLAMYLNTVVNIFDPHTEYFPPKDKENFDIALSGRLEGIGATLQEKDGSIKVTRIVPGSASWRQGQLKVGDVIVKVGQANQEPVDIVGMQLDEAVGLIRGKKGTEVRLTVKKADGSFMVIPIIRDVVVIEETYAQSAIIEKNQEKIGYIHLPVFYADFNKEGGRNCAEDVKKELLEFREANIKKVILDVRNNGGGSLQEVVNIVGLFIKNGPVVQVRSKIGTPQILGDYDPSVYFDGSLLIMINTNSASASEILAAAIQDYNRGIVVGSSSFGKGTVQKFFNLDENLNSIYSGMKALGSLKITTQKFYRITGEATQLKGVFPDITFPDTYDPEIKEKEQDYPIVWDEISPVKFELWQKSPLDIETIKEASESRTNNNETFLLIKEKAEKLEQQKKETIHTLNLKKYREEQAKKAEEVKKYEDIEKEILNWNISSFTFQPKDARLDSVRMSRDNDFHKAIKKDAHLFEAVSIVQNIN